MMKHGGAINVVAALLPRGDEILLVQEQGPNDPVPIWMLPGGVVEPGELLVQALRREVREETGLEVTLPGRLLYVVQYDNLLPRQPGRSTYISTTFVFELTHWTGEIAVCDPDELVLCAEFVPQAEARRRVEASPIRVMREPLVAYLEGKFQPGAMWFYQRNADGQEMLLGSIGT